MYPTKCPRCNRDYVDDENRLSILLTGLCFIYCLDDAREEELARWEAEGGWVMRNDIC